MVTYSTDVTLGFERTALTAMEGSSVEVCVAITSGALEREAVVTLMSSDGSADGKKDTH